MVCQAVEYNDRLGLAHKSWNTLDRVQNNLSDLAGLSGVRQAEAEFDPSLVGAAIVDNGVCQHICVRQDYHPSIRCSHFSGAQVDRQYSPIKTFHANRFAHMEGLLQQQDDSGSEVLHDVLQGKANRKPDNAKPGQEGGHIHELLQGSNDTCENNRPERQLSKELDNAGGRSSSLEYASKEIADQPGNIQAENKNNKRGKQFGRTRHKKSNKLINILFHLLSPS